MEERDDPALGQRASGALRGVVFVFELLALLFVFLPLLSGMSGPLSDPFWPLVALLLLGGIAALVLARLSRVPLSALCREWVGQSIVLERIWQGLHWLQSRPRQPALLSLATFGVFAVYSMGSVARHFSLDSHAYDLGIFTNTVYNLVFGDGYYSAVKGGIQLFSDHQSPSFWLFAPAFWIWPSPLTLLLLQAGLLSACGALAWLWIQKVLSQYRPRGQNAENSLDLGRIGAGSHGCSANCLAWVGAIAVWCTPALRNANAFDFHPEVIMLPAFLLGFLLWDSPSKWKQALGWISLLIALGAKESAGPVAVGMGLGFALILRPLRARACLLVGLGLVVFLVDVLLVPSWISAMGGTSGGGAGLSLSQASSGGGGKAAYAYSGLYSQYGGTLREMLLAPLLKPTLFWSQIFGPARLRFFFAVVAPLAFLPLFCGSAWLALSPALGMLFLSQGDHRVNIHYHYGIEPMVALIAFLPFGMIAVLRRQVQGKKWTVVREDWRDPRGVVEGKIFIGLVLCCALLSHQKSEIHRLRQRLTHLMEGQHQRWIRSELIPSISEDVTLAATEALVPQLAVRRWVHPLGVDPVDFQVRWIKERVHQVSWVDCVIVDSELSNWPLDPSTLPAIERKLLDWGFQSIYACGGSQVFARSEWMLAPPVSDGGGSLPQGRGQELGLENRGKVAVTCMRLQPRCYR